MMTKGLLAALITWGALVGPAGAEDLTRRVDFFDVQGRRTGYAVIDERTGRVDLFDTNSRRTGYGRLSPSGIVEQFDLDGGRQGIVTLPGLPERTDR